MSRYSRPHLIRLCGLALSFVGTVIVGVAGYWGLAAGYGGPIVWVSPSWRIAWLLGWSLLAIGFFLQLVGEVCPGSAPDAPLRPTSAVNPLAHFSDDELVAQHSNSGVNSHFLSEMTRRLMRSNERLSKWLLVFTVAIFLLTGVLVCMAVREMLR